MLLPVTSVFADAMEAAEKDIAAKWKALKSVSANFTYKQDVKTPQFSARSNGSGSFRYLVIADGAQKFRMNMKSTMLQKVGGQEMKSTNEVSMVDDGTTLLTYTKSDPGQEMAMKAKSNPEQIGGGGAVALKQMKNSFTSKLLPDADVDGKKCYVFEGVPKEMAPGMAAKNHSYFDKASGMLVKLVGMDAEGNTVQEMHYQDIKLNESIGPEEFVLKIPDGVQIMDMTAGGYPGQ
jgi:outer membrane lipoprotein-sorting protein